MKRFLTIGLRLFGVALIVFILTRIPYRDVYITAEGAEIRGVIDEEARLFLPADGTEPLPLPEAGAEGPEAKPGLIDILNRSDKLLILLCALAFGPITLISITRWWYLLRKVGIPVGWPEAFRLSYIGFFFNSAVPGLTGGDLVKAFYIARRTPGARVRAFMSVLVDRVIGLFALGLLAGILLLPRLTDRSFRGPALIVFIFLGTCLVFGAVFLSRRLRRLVRLESLIRKLPPVFSEVDRGISIYRNHPRAVLVCVLLSLLNHVCITFTALGIGRALGIDIPAVQFFILVPVCMMMASIPALPGGWGVREVAFALFFGTMAVPASRAFALSVLMGLTQLGWSLLGGLIFLLRPDRVRSDELSDFSQAVEDEVETDSRESSGAPE